MANLAFPPKHAAPSIWPNLVQMFDSAIDYTSSTVGDMVDPMSYFRDALQDAYNHGRGMEYSRIAGNIAERASNRAIKIDAINAINETYGISFIQQPRTFVFTLGVPQLRTWTMGAMVEQRHTTWLKSALDCVANGQEDEALDYIAIGTTTIKTKQNELERLSDELDQLDLSKLPNIILISLLRNTYSFRSSVSNWTKLLERTEKILDQRKEPVRKLLRGLRS